MNKNDKTMRWFFYVGWVLSGLISLVFSFIFAWLSLALFKQIFGVYVWVAGVRHITEDYLFAYAFIPWFGLAMGLLQYFLLRERLGKMRGWILITTLGSSLAWLGVCLRYNPIGAFQMPDSTLLFVSASILLGFLVGWAQERILRMHLPHAVWWIPAQMLGFGIGGLFLSSLSSLYQVFVAIFVPFIVTGILLWIWLEQSPHRAYPKKDSSDHPFENAGTG